MSAIDISVWPELPYRAWKDTYATLHLWSQIVGKIETRTNALAKPFVARHALCISYGPGHIPNSLRRSNI